MPIGGSRVCVFPAGFGSNFRIMVGSASVPCSTFTGLIYEFLDPWRPLTSGGWWKKFEVGLWHTGTINQTVRLIWTQILYLQFFCQSSPSQTEIGVEIVELVSCPELITWVRHCHVIENCATTDHETSLDFSSLGRQKNCPFQLRFEDADWQNFMSHLEYIYILNQDLTKFYKDPPPVGDFSIAPQLKLRCADRQREHIVMVKTYFSQKIF